MTITRIWQSSFSTNVHAHEFDGNLGSGSAIMTSAGGIYDNGAVLSIGSSSSYKSITGIAQLRMGFYARHDGVATGDNPELVVLRNSTTNVIVVKWDGYQFELLSGATSLATAACDEFWPIQKWVHVSLDVKIDASAGWVKFCVNGRAVFDYSGKTDHGASTIDRFGFGAISGTITWTNYLDIDHAYVEDTTGEGSASIAPPIAFVVVRPNGNGNYSQWDGSDGNSTDNYLLVDESSANTSDYVSTAVSTERDSYIMGTTTIMANFTVNAVVLKADALSDASESIKLFSRLSSTDLDGASQALAATYFAYTERQTAKPGGGSWAQADIDALEVGVLYP